MNHNNQTEEEFLKSYESSRYEKPSVAVDMLIFTVTNHENENIRKLDEKELKILLVKRTEHPYLDCWSLPGGFAGMDESLEDTVKRKLKENAELENIYLEQIYSYGDVNRDPRMRVISVAYMALVPNQDLLHTSEKHSEHIQWFRIQKRFLGEHIWQISLIGEDDGTKISYQYEETYAQQGVLRESKAILKEQEAERPRLAFDHSRMLTDTLLRMRNKADYVPIAFNLAGELFTRAEIQSIYEILLDKKLTRVELWRKIKDMVLETDLMKNEKGHRPSKYYRFRLEDEN